MFSLLKTLRRTPRVTVTPGKGRAIVIPFRAASVFLILILIVLSGFLALRSDLFLVRNFKVEIVGSSLSKGFIDSGFIYESLQKFSSRSILFVNQKEIAKTVSDISLVIKNVEVTKIFPDTLTVRIQLREAVAEVISGENHLLIDKDGFIFAKSPSNVSLPQINLLDGEAIGIAQSLNPALIQNAIKVIVELGRRNLFKVKSLDLPKDQSIAVLAENNLTIYFKSNATILWQVQSLEAILQKAKLEKGKLVKVDFRFERPIVVFQ